MVTTGFGRGGIDDSTLKASELYRQGYERSIRQMPYTREGHTQAVFAMRIFDRIAASAAIANVKHAMTLIIAVLIFVTCGVRYLLPCDDT
jgi:hypothetical protein